MTPTPLTADQLRSLAGLVSETRPHELTCDEWVDRVAGFAEAVLAGTDPPAGAELVEQHVALCPECREEFEALMAALRGGGG